MKALFSVRRGNVAPLTHYFGSTQMIIEYTIMEAEVLALLQQHAVNGHARHVLAPWVAYESLKMNHLYEDLGFHSRTEMGRFMKGRPRLRHLRRPGHLFQVHPAGDERMRRRLQ